MADQDDQIIKFIGFAQLGELSEMRALMRRYNLDVNVSYDVSGTTALLAAISFNQVKCVEWLINSGADVNLGDKEGRTPLHYAAKISKPLAYKLLQHKANVNARARNGMTPLHCAFQTQQLDIAVLLLNNGADITIRDTDKRLPTDLASELFVNEVHRRTRRRYMTADELSAQVSEEEVHEPEHAIEDSEEPVLTRVKPRASPHKHHVTGDESAQDEIELLRGALREAQRALEQSDSKKVQQAITLYKQAALTRTAEVNSMSVRIRELETELHARDVEIRELKRRIEDMRVSQRQSRANTPSSQKNKRRRSTSSSPRPNKRRRVSKAQEESREEDKEEEEDDEDEDEEVEEQVEEEDDDDNNTESSDEDEDGGERQTPRVRTRSASKQNSAQKTPRAHKSPTQPRSSKKSSGKQQKQVTESSESSEDESSAESEQRGKNNNKKGKEDKKGRKSDVHKTTDVSIAGQRDRGGNTEWRVSSAGGTKTWMTSSELKTKYGNKVVQEAINRYKTLHSKKK